MHALAHDLRLALRSILKRPGFSLLAVLTLGLGLGATTAIFTVVQGVLLEPLPYDEPDQVVLVLEKNPSAGFERFTLSPLNYRDYRDMNGTFEHLAASTGSNLAFTPSDGGPAQRWSARMVTHQYLDALRVQPLHGRDFTPQDDQPGAAPTLLLGHSQWLSLGGDPGIVGQRLRLDGESREVIGVLPPDVHREIGALVPLRLDYERAGRGGHWLRGTGRLEDGVTIDAARQDLERIAAALEAEYPDTNTGWGSLILPLHEAVVENVEQALWVLMLAVAVVLLIACANVANLTLTRLAQRERDVAVQSALGAPRWAIVRQMLIESLLVAGVAGLVGLGLAIYGVRAILALELEVLPRATTISFSAPVLLFGFLLTLLTAMLFGLFPALQAARPNVIDAMKSGGRTQAAGSGRLRTGLVVAEVALALMLTIAGGLLVRSYANLLSVDSGLELARVWTANFSLPNAEYGEDAEQVAFFESLMREVRALPGVEAAATVTPMPLSGGDYVLSFTHQGRPIPPPNEEPKADIRFITGDYFDAMGIELQRGRVLDSNDRQDRELAIVINRAAADAFWPDGPAIDRRITFGRPDDGEPNWYRVVGIVGDVRHGELHDEAGPAFYLSALQATTTRSTIVIKTAGDPGIVAGPLRGAMARLDANVPLYREQAGAAYLDHSLAEPRFNTTLLGLFAGLALTLSAIGVFGVISFTVAQQIREIGVRMALGADGGRIITWVMRRGLAPVAWGIAIGLGGAVLATRLLQNLVYGVPTLDLVTYLVVAGILALVAAVACLVPALRASSIEPVVVLRSE